MDVNVNGVLFTAQAAGRQMARFGNGGSIVLIASMSGSITNKVRVSTRPSCTPWFASGVSFLSVCSASSVTQSDLCHLPSPLPLPRSRAFYSATSHSPPLLLVHHWSISPPSLPSSPRPPIRCPLVREIRGRAAHRARTRVHSAISLYFTFLTLISCEGTRREIRGREMGR